MRSLLAFLLFFYACLAAECQFIDKFGDVYDLFPFRGKVFSSKLESGESFFFSVCGDCPKCGAGNTACTILDGKVTSYGASSSYKLDIGDNDQLELQYKSSSSDNHVEIFFQCAVNKPKNELTIEKVTKLEADPTSIIVSAISFNGCISSHPTPKCRYSSPSGLYDLTPLKGKTFTGKTSSGETLYFSVCGDCSKCEPGVAACSEANGIMSSYGLTASSILDIGDNDELELKLQDDSNRHVSIFFTCSSSNTLNVKSVTKVEESNSFIVSTDSKFGCVFSSTCMYYDSFDNLYDLTPFKGKTFQYELSSEEKVYFSVCGDCDYCGEGNAACIIRGQEVTSYGATNSYKLDIGDNDQLELQYKSSSSDNHVEIFFQCAANKPKNELTIEKVTKLEADPTSLIVSAISFNGCISSHPVPECKFTDRFGDVYDLTPFKGKTFTGQTEDGNNLYFSVCGDCSKCEPGVAACSEANGVISSYGLTASYKLDIGDNDELELKLQDDSNRHVSIFFTCAANGPKDSLEINAVNKISDDSFVLSVSSHNGCIGDHPVPECKYTDLYGNIYDLSSLKGLSFTALTSDNQPINFSVCGDCSKCEPGVAACAEANGVMSSYGLTASYNLDIGDNDELELKLTDDSNRHVSIFFTCKRDAVKNNLQDSSATKLADDAFVISTTSFNGCISNPPNPSCIYKTEYDTYDLTPLKGKTYSRLVEESGKTLYFSVCGECSKCEPGISACAQDSNGLITSYGLTASYKLDIGDSGSLELKLADSDSKRNVEVFIDCDVDKEFSITGVGGLESSFIVSASSSYGCSSKCTLQNYDLTPLMKSVFSGKTDKKEDYKFSLCLPLRDEDLSASTVVLPSSKISAGKFASRTTKVDTVDYIYSITYSNGSPCKGDINSQTVIYLSCNEKLTAKVTSASFSDSSCTLSVQLDTKYVCDDINDDSGNNDDKNNGSHSSFPYFLLIVGICLLIGLTYFVGGILFNLFRGRSGIELIPHHKILCCCVSSEPVYAQLTIDE